MTGAAQAAFGRDVFTYGDPGVVAGMVMIALALKKSANTLGTGGRSRTGTASQHRRWPSALVIGAALLFAPSSSSACAAAYRSAPRPQRCCPASPRRGRQPDTSVPVVVDAPALAAIVGSDARAPSEARSGDD